MASRTSPKLIRPDRNDLPVERFVKFIHLLCLHDKISKSDVMETLKIGDTSFYKHLKNARELFSVYYVGSIGDNAYYSIDKTELAKYFNIKRHHTSSS